MRFPTGTWVRFADARALAWRVEEMLAKTFPDLEGRVVVFATLTSEFEVKEFERSLAQP